MVIYLASIKMKPEKNSIISKFFWRRSFDIPPPGGESLKNTAERVLPYFKKEILPQLLEGKNILIAAHGNSLRSLVMELDQLTKEQVVKLEIATGDPIYYEIASSGKVVKI